MHQHGFGQFQLQAGGRQAGARQGVGDAVHQIATLELNARQVDRHHQLTQPFGTPLRQLTAGFVQHPFANGHNQAAFFRHRNELARRHHALFRVQPAHQCFGTNNPACGQVKLWLVVQDEFIAQQRIVQAVANQQLLGGVAAVLAGKEAEGIASGFLGRTHGRFGVLQQGIVVAAVIRGQRHANRQGGVQCLVSHQQRGGKGRQQCLGALGQRMQFAHMRHHQQKFVCTMAGQHVVIAHLGEHARRCCLEQLVARGLA